MYHLHLISSEGVVMGGVLSYRHMDIVQLCSARFSSNLVWVGSNFLRIKKIYSKMTDGCK